MTLYQQIKKLSEGQLRQLERLFVNSPKSLAILHLIIKSKNTLLNKDIINNVYTEEIALKGFKIAENNFFKLKARIEQTINSIDTPDSVVQNADLFLYNLKHTTLYDKKWTAIQDQLKKLEQFFENNFIIEKQFLLYETILHKKRELSINIDATELKKQERVKRLYADFLDAKEASILGGSFYNKYGKNAANDYLAKLKYLTQKHKSNIRFKLIYNYAASRFKLNITVSNAKNKVNKHIQTIKQIHSEYPLVPLFEDVKNNKEYLDLLFLSVESHYYWDISDVVQAEMLLEKKCIY
ncbi:MAG: hypothetical protein J0M08_03395 [Bacteroidetes bacterium]|nr:hypothetical protein [Bacteroidota bacterium]